MLSRLQFAAATMFHFIFVPLSMGLAVLIAIMETRYVRTGDQNLKRLIKFWGKIFIATFVVGVVTGLTLEFQFGTNWSRYSAFVGDVFGSLLAIEVLATFFLESTFIAVWIFGWDRVSPRVHLAAIWLVAIAAVNSAFWILTANAWMQNPVGYVIRNGRAELVDFLHVIFQWFAILEVIHTVAAAFVVAGFFVLAVSAYQILRRHHVELFTYAFKVALVFTFINAVIVAAEGDFHAKIVAAKQPAKLAAMEAQWETESWAPMVLFQIPDVENERNIVNLVRIPGALSILAYYYPSAVVKGLKDFPPEDRPPVALTFYSFRLMVLLGFYFPILTFFGLLRWRRIAESRRYLKVVLYSLPLPFIAVQVGWIVTEVGRQPWIVYNLVRTRDAVSPIAASQVAVSLVAFVLVYSLAGLIAAFVITRFVRRGIPDQSESHH